MGDTGYVQSNAAVSGRWPGWSGFLLCGIIPVEWEIHLWTDALAAGIRSNTKQVLLSQSRQNICSTSIIAHDFTKGNGKNCNCLPFYICLCIIIAVFIPPPKRDGGDSADFMIKIPLTTIPRKPSSSWLPTRTEPEILNALEQSRLFFLVDQIFFFNMFHVFEDQHADHHW